MGSKNKSRRRTLCLALLIVSVLIVSCEDGPRSAVNMDSDGIAIKGYDTVAYFKMRKPVRGDERYAYEWNDATWLFSSNEHLALFAADPEQYAPQFGGY